LVCFHVIIGAIDVDVFVDGIDEPKLEIVDGDIDEDGFTGELDCFLEADSPRDSVLSVE